MDITDKEKTEFLLKLAQEDYTQGSEYHAYRSKKGKWHFGHTNDYPLQHGNGNNTILSDNMVETLMKREVVNNLLISDVSNRRELLINFLNWHDSENLGCLPDGLEGRIDEYLKLIHSC